MMRIQLDLRKVSLVHIVEKRCLLRYCYTRYCDASARPTVTKSLKQNHDFVGHRLDRLEQLLMMQKSLLQLNKLLPTNNDEPSATGWPHGQSFHEGLSASNDIARNGDTRGEGICIQTSQYSGAVCRSWCPCGCH